MSLLKQIVSRRAVLAVLPLALMLTSCLREQEERPLGSRGDYIGCLQAEATGKDSAQIQVDLPAQASEVQIYRNGTWVGSVFPGNITNNVFKDESLPAQGEVYRYSCRAIVNNESQIGYNELTIQTIPEDAPLFDGLEAVTIENNIEAKLTWKSPNSNGPRVKKYKIYANLDTSISPASPSIDLTQTPVAEIPAPASSYTIQNFLGDKLPYVFSVAACTFNDLCSGTSVFKTASTLENGTPNTPGVESIRTISGGVEITAPWNHSMGEITKRTIYMGTLNTTDLSSFLPIRAIPVALDDLKNPNTLKTLTTIEIIDSRIQENSQYYFALVDQDSLGNKSATRIYALHTYDLTPPSFPGITSVIPNSAQPSTAMDIQFQTSATEGAPDYNPNGASYYYVLYTETPYLTSTTTPSPSNPCRFGVKYPTEFAANPGGVAGGIPAVVTVTGLTPRTYYRFCMKAVDASGNESGEQDEVALIPKSTLDTEPPLFDGIQGLSGVYDGGQYKIKVTWNKASDAHSSIKSYQVKIWSNNSSSTASGNLETLVRDATSSNEFDTGTLIVNNVDYAYGQGQTLYVLVNACDTADDIPGGTSQCTNFGDELAMTISPPDIEPPVGFQGITSATSNVNGEITVGWAAPSPWTPDFFKFRIYDSVLDALSGNYTLTLLKECPCAIPGACSSATDLTCTLTGLTPNMSYRLHVRAVDAVGNEAVLNPATSWNSVKVKDEIPPVFTPQLSAVWDSSSVAVKLSWQAATDNQLAGSEIEYEIFRRRSDEGGNFTGSELTNPPSSASRGKLTNVTSFTDIGTYATGTTYYYHICASDEQGNRTCGAWTASTSIPDTESPQFLSVIQSNKTADTDNLLRRWYLEFDIEDNVTPLDRINIKVYRSFTAAASTPPAESTYLDPDASLTSNREDTEATKTIRLKNLAGKTNSNGYVNYLIVAEDEAGNKAQKTLSFTYDSRLALTSIASAKAKTTESSELVVAGSGFTKQIENGTDESTKVYLGAYPCENVQVFSTTLLTCESPVGSSPGPADVVVLNPDGTSAKLANAFTFTNGAAYPHDLCSTSEGTNPTPGPFAAGDGSNFDPYIVCTPSQFQQIASYSSGGSFKLGAHIDLSGGFTSISTFNGVLDGAGFMIFNYEGSLPLFASLNGATTFMNLILLNNKITCINANCGLLAGSSSDNNANYVFESITLVANTLTNPSYSGTFGLLAKSIYSKNGLSVHNISAIGNEMTFSSSAVAGFLVGQTNSYAASSTNATFKNITIKGTMSCPITTSKCGAIGGRMNHVSFDGLEINLNSSNNVYVVLGEAWYVLSGTESWGVSDLKNIVTSYNAKGLAGQMDLKEGGVIENITVHSSTGASSLFKQAYLRADTKVRNITIHNMTAETIYGLFEELNFQAAYGTGVEIEDIKIQNLLATNTGVATLAFKAIPYTFFLSGNVEHMAPLKVRRFSAQGSLRSSPGSAALVKRFGTSQVTPSGTSVSSRTLMEVQDVYLNVAAASGLVSDIWKNPGGTSYSSSDFQPYITVSNTLIVGAHTYAVGGTNETYSNWSTNNSKVTTALCHPDIGSAGNFWDTASTQTSNATPTSASCPGFSALPTADLLVSSDPSAENVYLNSGWDFSTVWKLPETGSGYPQLR